MKAIIGNPPEYTELRDNYIHLDKCAKHLQKAYDSYADYYKWIPIESAIKDGTTFLLWKQNTREHYVAAWTQGAYGGGWCTPDGYEVFDATHWMLLPLPPQPTTESK